MTGQLCITRSVGYAGAEFLRDSLHYCWTEAPSDVTYRLDCGELGDDTRREESAFQKTLGVSQRRIRFTLISWRQPLIQPQQQAGTVTLGV